jgi:hypothetical protein
MKKKISLLFLSSMLLITTTFFATPIKQTASAATITSDSTNVIVTPQSYTITYYRTEVPKWYPSLEAVESTYFYTEYYKEYGFASGNLQLIYISPNSGAGYMAYYSGYMYCTTN